MALIFVVRPIFGPQAPRGIDPDQSIDDLYVLILAPAAALAGNGLRDWRSAADQDLLIRICAKR
ncbi:hypothetical protein [Fodinicurvata sp. EGI_FJ10296]|uniref:hypothetical protein n=1 Tax=Fodinicurvata sp. EGI_FJ10296 TaxID=3231908 RepID=UPI00345464EF